MEQVTFETDNKNDVKLLITIAERLGIKKHQISKKVEAVEKTAREGLLRIIDAGADVSNFGDPSSWQRETRKNSFVNIYGRIG